MSILQPEGVAKILPLGKLTDFEQGLVKAAVPELATNIDKVNNRILSYQSLPIDSLFKGVSFITSPKL